MVTDTPATRSLRWLVGTQTLSTVGSTTTGLGLALWLYGQEGSVTLLGLLFVAATVPGLVLGPWAGAVVDRVPRRLAMLAADGTAAVATALALAIAASGALAAWHVVLVAAIGSAAGAFQEPAYGAVIAANAPDDQLERLNGLVQLGPAVGIVAGPALAGLLLALGGLPIVLLADLASFLVAVAALVALRFDDEAHLRAGAGAARPQVREGWRLLRTERGLLRVTLGATAVNLLFGLVNVLLIPLLLGLGGQAGAGLAMSTLGVGMLVGTTLAAAAGRRGRAGAVIGYGLVVLGVGVGAAGIAPTVALVAASAFVLAFPVPILSAAAQGLTQRTVPRQLLGRVLGLRRTLATAALPVAQVGAGPLVDRVFEPWLQAGGALAPTLGRVVGTGVGRGAAAVFVLAGLGVVAIGVQLTRDRHVRALDQRLETERRAVTGRPEVAVGAVS